MSYRPLLYAFCAVFSTPTSAPAAPAQSSVETGRRLFDGVFDPRSNFAGDLTPSSMDEMILTVAASGRDDYAPAFSLAVAHLCESIKGSCRPRYVARVLRVSADQDQWTDRGLTLVSRLHKARSAKQQERVLEGSGLQWLEADIAACEGVTLAIDTLRGADWRPDLPLSLAPQGEGDIILHPAMIRSKCGAPTCVRATKAGCSARASQ